MQCLRCGHPIVTESICACPVPLSEAPEEPSNPMVVQKSWEEFRQCKMLWWVNRMIHIFGWAICVTVEEDGTISGAYPARVRFRGFDLKSEAAGFIGLTEYMQQNGKELVEETKE